MLFSQYFHTPHQNFLDFSPDINEGCSMACTKRLGAGLLSSIYYSSYYSVNVSRYVIPLTRHHATATPPQQTETRKKGKLRRAIRAKLPQLPLRENIWTIPNALSAMRIALTPVIGYCVVTHQMQYALAGFVVASFSDLVHLFASLFPLSRTAVLMEQKA